MTASMIAIAAASALSTMKIKAVAKKNPGSAARYSMNDYRSWLIGRFPGGAAGLTAAGFGAGSAPRTWPEASPVRAAPRNWRRENSNMVRSRLTRM